MLVFLLFLKKYTDMFLNRLFLLGFFFWVSVNTYSQIFNEIEYQESTENFPNPGRGFYHAVENVNYENILSFREEGISLIFKTYKLDDFKTGQISLGFLNKMKSDFATLRRSGSKMIIRFSYTEKSSPPYGDAPLPVVLQHIEQLKPVLRENSDVILVLQAGFIGAWGEWYYTDYFSQSPGIITDENWNDRRTLTDSLLEMMPADRMVQVRTPNYKRRLLDMEDYIPVSPQQAYTGEYIARIAHHNDCFVSSNNDVGTYIDTLVEKPYLAEDSKYTVVGGETCGQCSYSHCENAVRELKRFHWSFLNRDYHLGVIGDWIEEGCYDDILLKLGYRYRLINAVIQNESRPGGNFIINLNLWNDGWANPANPQMFKVVLKNSEDGSEYYISPVNDMRFFPFEDTIHINIEAGLPYNIPEGNYEVFLQITDADPLLSGRKEYSIRLANVNVWDDETGYNNLQHSLSVTQTGGEVYYGCNIFKPQNNIVESQEIVVDGNPDDWDDVPLLCITDNQNARLFKVYNSPDTLYFFFKGDGMNTDFRIFINNDNDTATGLTSPDWPGAGSDYMVDNNQLFIYSGINGQFEWEFIQDILSVQNDSIIESSVPVSSLQNGITDIYGLAAVINYSNGNEKSIFPQPPASVLPVNKNRINGAPAFVGSKNLGNINVVYWTKNQHQENTIIHLQRSESLTGEFETVFSCRNSTISYYDKDLNENQYYYYRMQYRDGGQISPFSDTIAQVTETGITNHFISVILDGQSEDWTICPPVATGIISGGMTALRFFNNADSLFFSIESYNGNSYSLCFNVNSTPGFDYKLSNDSLFSVNGNINTFIKIIPSYQSENFLESGFGLSDIAMDSTDMFYSQLNVDGKQLWDKTDGFGYMKYEVLPEPEGYNLEPSVSNPYTRIKIKWTFDSNPSGYIIERSVSDSLNFEKLAELSGNDFYYLDDGLDSSLTYYYRMYSFKDLIRSEYTPIKWMQPGNPSSIAINKLQTGNVKITPNPVGNSFEIDITLTISDDITISLYNINGEKVSNLFSGKVAKSSNLSFKRDGIGSGLYLLKVAGEKTLLYRKIVFY
jgi:hypothetical protein